MTIKVTINVVPNEQFDLHIEPPVEDRQLQLPSIPAEVPMSGELRSREVSLEFSPIEEAVPLSYGVPPQTGIVVG